MRWTNRYMIRIISVTAVIFSYSCLSIAPYLAAEEKAPAGGAAAQQDKLAGEASSDTSSILKTSPLDTAAIIQGLLAIRNDGTKLMPSHFGHPGYENVGFIYDLSVAALILYAAGYQAEAETILDYFTRRLDIPIEDIIASADTNNVFGILKIFRKENLPGEGVRAIVNAIDISATNYAGRGILEFYTTPGPTAFLIFALLQVNSEKYKKYALGLGDALLRMQNKNGGVMDGDRAADRVHTEPHMDCYSAFMMLYQVSGDRKWLNAANGAFDWFLKHAYDRKKTVIHQGVWKNRPSKIFATDVYSWTMAGPAGDKLPADELKKLTRKMLDNCITRTTFNLPDNSRRTAILSDFSNAGDSRVVNSRQGFHPMGTIEWTGGVALAIQKNAVRLWNKGDRETARQLKALAMILLREAGRCFYAIDGQAGLMSFYATGQGVEVAPFGAIQNKSVNGWITTYYYARRPDNTVITKGGAAISAWVILPYLGVNPFILHDGYKKSYDAIPIDNFDIVNAMQVLNDIASKRTYSEEIPGKVPDKRIQVVEPRMFNKEMWDKIKRGYQAKREGNITEIKRYFTEAEFWASKVLQNKAWVNLARSDNEMKRKEFGGLIFYPWGATYPNNEDPVHFAIQRYPLLNEVSAAAWALATASYELGKKDEAKMWIERIIDEFPLHQIPVVEDEMPGIIKGYWNAIVSWEDKTIDPAGDPGIYSLYQDVLTHKNIRSAKPPTVMFSDTMRTSRPEMPEQPKPESPAQQTNSKK